MKKPCKTYTDKDISLFVDNQLSRDQKNRLEQHLHLCPDCSRLVKQYKTISILFNDHVDHKNLRIDPDKLKQKLAWSTPHKKSLKNAFGFFGQNIYLKLASIAAILMISLFTFQGGLFRFTGPSAIVTSVDTDFSSVMIIETQKEKHTIIWFSET